MHNLQPIDLHDVESYWKSRNLVDERHLPYYIRWLQRFLAGPGGDSRLSAQDAERVFVEHLDRSGDVPEWQVQQAARAVEIYQKHYLSHRAETAGPGTAPPTVTKPTTLEAAMEETRRLVRVRHYAYRTEQTYMAWLAQYRNFVKKSGLPWDVADTARAFLAELALQRNVAASTQKMCSNV